MCTKRAIIQPHVARCVNKQSEKEKIVSAESFESLSKFNGIVDEERAVHAYSTGGDLRVVRVVELNESGKFGNLLGYGIGDTLYDALTKASESYSLRQELGQVAIDLNDENFAEFKETEYISRATSTSKLDSLVSYGQELLIQRSENEVVAWPLMLGSIKAGRGSTVEAATAQLTNYS